jgi:hypothetical protein
VFALRPSQLRKLLAPTTLGAVLCWSAGADAHAESGKGPVGWDVYRRLDLLPMLRVGDRTRQYSSYDRSGGNDDGRNGTYSCLRRVADGCLIAERDGPGQVESIWFTRDFGNVAATGRLRVRLDGRTVLDAPLADVVAGKLGAPFVSPLVANSEQSSGGVYLKVPMAFRESMRITTEHHPGFYHVTYRAFADAKGVRRFDPDHQARDVVSKFRAAGTSDPKPRVGRRTLVRRIVRVPSGRRTVLIRKRGAGLVTALRMRMRELRASEAVREDEVLRRSRLQMTFDGVRTVDAPLGEFFGSGLGRAPVRSLLFAMGPRRGDWLKSWWPMPYARSVSIALTNPTGAAIGAVETRLSVATSQRWARALGSGAAGYFRATGRGPAETRRGHDWLFLDTRGRGAFAGVTHTMRGARSAPYIEGDERVYVDGSKRPQLHGTGTEDFYEGGWYFTRSLFSTPFTLPLNGFTKELEPASGCPRATCKTAYRLMLGDAVPFRSSLRFGIEHGSENGVDAEYSSTAYWYGDSRSK